VLWGTFVNTARPALSVIVLNSPSVTGTPEAGLPLLALVTVTLTVAGGPVVVVVVVGVVGAFGLSQP
jgi:hypothetical protein